jgi:hypothetical protein
MHSAESEDPYLQVIHATGTDLNVPLEAANQADPPDDYFYTVQLMDSEHKFEGSFMEVKSKAISCVHSHPDQCGTCRADLSSPSRDRFGFSKSILKRYLRECCQRDTAVGAPWIVKPSIAQQFGVTQERSDLLSEKNREERERVLSKRRKVSRQLRIFIRELEADSVVHRVPTMHQRMVAMLPRKPKFLQPNVGRPPSINVC